MPGPVFFFVESCRESFGILENLGHLSGMLLANVMIYFFLHKLYKNLYTNNEEFVLFIIFINNCKIDLKMTEGEQIKLKGHSPK